MASSGSIRAEINQCKAEIEACRQEIQETEELLALQEEGYEDYAIKKGGYEQSFANASNQTSKVAAFTNVSIVAKKYAEKLGTMLEGPKKETVLANLDKIKTELYKEVKKTEDKLEQLRQKLANLQTRLGDLEASYQRARDRERDEEARKAEAKKSK